MEDLDLTLKLGLPVNDQVVDSNEGPAIGTGCNDGATNNVNVNLMVSNYIMQKFSGAGKHFSGGSSSSGNQFSGGISGEMNPRRDPPAPTPVPVMGNNEFVLIDVPERRAQRGRANANANANAGYNVDTSYLKRCTNFNCTTTDTPMWRKGPLGPKTLCNACGIKYRKEEERKRGRGEAASNNTESELWVPE